MQAVAVPVPQAAQAIVLQAAPAQQAAVPAVIAQPAHQVGQLVYVARDPRRAPVIELYPPVLPPIDELSVHRAAAAAQAADPNSSQLNYLPNPGRVVNRGVGRGRYPRVRRAEQPADDDRQPKRRRIGKNVKTSDRERDSVVTAYHDASQTVPAISNVTQLKPSTVRSILRAFQQRGHAHKLPRGGNHKPTIPDDVKQYVTNAVESRSQVKLREIRAELTAQKDQLNLVTIPSLASIQRIIEKGDITTKLVSFVPISRNTEEVKEKRKEYADWATRELLSDSTAIFIDEFGCNVSMRRRKGRSKRGTPAIVRVDGLRNRNLSVLVAMSPVYGIQICYTRTQAFDGETFAVFLKSLAEKLRRDHPAHRFVFILDNAKFHKCEEVKALIPNLGYTVRYLPPYSPFLNPIEECFSKWKTHITDELTNDPPAQPENVEAKYLRITTAAEKAMTTIRREDCFNWNIHSKGFWNDCLHNRDIDVQPSQQNRC